MLKMRCGHWVIPVLVFTLLFCCSRSETLNDYSHVQENSTSLPSTNTLFINPSPTSIISSSSESSSSLTSIFPSPTPIPEKPLILYEDGHSLYLRIEEIFIRFTGDESRYFPEVNRTSLEQLGELTSNITHSPSSEIVFTKWFGSSAHNFSLKFTFCTDAPADNLSWFIKTITHSNPNVSSDRDVIFEYRGIQNSVKAPMGFVYICDKLHQIGYDSADPDVVATLDLKNITVQAFYQGKLSERKVSCDDPNKSNKKQTALIIGLVVLITITIAIIIVAISTFVMKWKKRREYDLLD